MTRPKFIVQAQRSNGVCYIDCEPMRATSFAVIKVKPIRLKGKQYLTKNFISRHQRKTQAEGEAYSQNLSVAGPLRRYGLGKRMERQA